MYSFTYLIPEEKSDNPYAHLHHAEVLYYLEKARMDLFNQLGLPDYDSFYKLGYGNFITRIEIDYKREVGAGEVRIVCEGLAVDGKAMRMTQKLFNNRGKEAVRAVVESMLVSLKTKRASVPPPDLAARFC